uniref:Angiopoietin-related protein 5-like n=1 Tax=Salarias fasciatus TaxID=181472 RepID=A0A672J4Q0_SALFA
MKMLIGLCGLILVLLSSVTAQLQKRPVDVFSQGSDCTEIKRLLPESRSGVYMIQPAASRIPFKVFCEMRPDGGWTVIQRRTGDKVSFRRNWASYEAGFGQLTGDHWLGLEKIHWLTRSKRTTLRVDLWDHEGGTAYAEYKNFNLGNRNTAYELHVGRYSGTAGDAIRGEKYEMDQNGFGFSTSDRDHDDCDPCISGKITVSECAQSDGGWWFSRCGSAALNGDYHESGDHIGMKSGLHWRTWKKPTPYSAKATRMMIKSE